MSRSKRKTKIFGNAGFSNKKDKKRANKKLRKLIKSKNLSNELIFPLIREVSNVWCFQKDGKHYWEKATKRDLLK